MYTKLISSVMPATYVRDETPVLVDSCDRTPIPATTTAIYSNQAQPVRWASNLSHLSIINEF